MEILYMSKDDASHMVYLWADKGQYPVAEIKNATAQVKTALGNVSPESLSQGAPNMTTINNLRKIPQILQTLTLPHTHTIHCLV